jgi:hypothetical protein
MINPARLFLVFWLTASAATGGLAQSTIKKEIDIGFAPLETIKPILETSISPVGKFVLLPNKGTVVVIDTPSGILAAEEAIAGAALPKADVALDFEFVTGLPPRRHSITVARQVPFVTDFEPPKIIVGPNGRFTVIPATPTKFRKRNIGVTSETTSTLNPDGSITMDINTEHTEFEGFINYGSAILPAGVIGTVPVNGRVADPAFFAPFIDAGVINMPIISTTRISTSIVIRPRVNLGAVDLDMMPRLTIEPVDDEQAERDPETVDLKKYRTTVRAQNGEKARVYGFSGASEDFNRRFFGAKDPDKGSTAIVVKAALRPPGSRHESESPVEAKGGDVSGASEAPRVSEVPKDPNTQ